LIGVRDVFVMFAEESIVTPEPSAIFGFVMVVYKNKKVYGGMWNGLIEKK